MNASPNISQKILLLLQKTKEALLLDLENEFVSLRKAIAERERYSDKKTTEGLFKELEKAKDLQLKIIHATFTRVGVDVSSLETNNLSNLSKAISNVLTEIDRLVEDLKDLSKVNPSEEGKEEFISKVSSVTVDHVKNIAQLVRDFSDIEADKILDELKNAGRAFSDSFNPKSLAQNILEHILITLLRNAQNVFADEISIVRSQVIDFTKSVTNAADTVKNSIQEVFTQLETEADQAKKLVDTIFKEAVNDLERAANNIDLEQVKSDLMEMSKQVDTSGVQDIYTKVSSTLSKIFIILDTFGLVGETTIHVELPKSVKEAIEKAAKEVETAGKEAVKEIKKATGTANSAINEGIGTWNNGITEVENLSKEAIDKLNAAATKVNSIIDTDLGLKADSLNLSQLKLSALNAQMGNIDTSFPKINLCSVSDITGLSYSFTITTIKWSKFEDIFTRPIEYFKEVYSFHDVEDAQKIIEKILNAARIFNPNIPNFKSLRSMLESLLQTILNKLMEATSEIRQKLWDAVKPLVLTIRKILDMLQELYQELKNSAGVLLGELEAAMMEVIEEIVPALENAAKGIKQEALEFGKKVNNEAEAALSEAERAARAARRELLQKVRRFNVPQPVKNFYDDILFPSVKAAIEKSSAPDPESIAKNFGNKYKAEFEEWGNGVTTSLADFFNEKAWKERLTLATLQLKLETEKDANALASIENLVSPETLKNISGSVTSKISELKKELDITDYINIVSNAVQDVSLPNPQLYFESFYGIFEKAVEDAAVASGKYNKEQAKQLAKDIAEEVWKRVKSKLIMPWVNEIKATIINVVRLVIRQTLQRIVTEINSAVKEAVKGIPIDSEAYNSLPTDLIFDGIGVIKDSHSEALKILMELKDGKTEIDGFSFNKTEWGGFLRAVTEKTIDFITSEMGYKDIILLIVGILKALPDSTKEYLDDLLPDLPKNITDYLSNIDYKCNLEDSFIMATLLKLENKDINTASENIQANAALTFQVCAYVGKDPDKKDDDEEAPALHFRVMLKGDLNVGFQLGSNHILKLKLDGDTGGGSMENKPENEASTAGFGCYVTEDWDIKPVANWDMMRVMLQLIFERGSLKASETKPWKIFDTKYIAFEIGNYPQTVYVGYDSSYPSDIAYLPKSSKNKNDGNTFQVGYAGAIEKAKITLKLKDVALLKEVLKDDIDLLFDTYLWYDFQKGFDFGGDVRLHLEYDMDHKKIGALRLDHFSLDVGTKKGDLGTLGFNVGSTFQVEFTKAFTMSLDDFGIGFDLNLRNKDGSLGNLDLLPRIAWPTGIGISINAPAVKGGGFISINRESNELLGALELNVIKKFTVGALLVCDPGTAPGHDFSLVVLISTSFSPGIPIGMGFSLTGIGGALGLNRQISRDGLIQGVRSGSLGSVFFVNDLEKHLAEMKESVLSIFPACRNQFFFGVLGQISFEPILKCDFGLMLQLPNPTEIIILGGLHVNVAKGIVNINVYFAGGIKFEEGMWFDASIVDSVIAGIRLSGDMAFRLNWGGQTKGFLLSIGGFHPAYRPEAGMQVSDMKRIAMKMNYKILVISLETYLAITSNTFQIGARLDLKIGWKKFGLFGYAGFDALFQFNPFFFMFSISAGVSVKCGSWKLLSIDLSMDVQGPTPWKVSGKAKFKFLFIPIKVKFSLNWGDKANELPSKTVSVMEVFRIEYEKDLNWICLSGDTTDNNQILMREIKQSESEPMIIMPSNTIEFNQSAVPLHTDTGQLDTSLTQLVVYNDALPIDYNNFKIESVNGVEVELLQNDFAPNLYKKMSLDEKLKSASYLKYNSGFRIKGNKRKSSNDGQQHLKIEKRHITPKSIKKSSTDSDPIINKDGGGFTPNMEIGNRGVKNKIIKTENIGVIKKEPYERIIEYGTRNARPKNIQLRNRNAFNRYIEIMDQKVRKEKDLLFNQ